MKQFSSIAIIITIILRERRGPFLKVMEAASEICEESINSYLVYPIIIFCIWVLMEVEV